MTWKQQFNNSRFSNESIATMGAQQSVNGTVTKEIASAIDYKNMPQWSINMIKKERFAKFHEMDLEWLPMDKKKCFERRNETGLPLDSDAKTVDVCFPNDDSRWLWALTNKYGLDSMKTFYKVTKILYKDRLDWLKETETPANLQKIMNNIIISYLHSNFTPEWIKKLTNKNLSLMKPILEKYRETTKNSNDIPNLSDLLLAKDLLLDAQSFDNPKVKEEVLDAAEQVKEKMDLEEKIKKEIDNDY